MKLSLTGAPLPPGADEGDDALGGASPARSYQDQEALDRRFMALALEEAREAGNQGEVPVGCVIVLADRVVARAGNRIEQRQDPTAHAEIIALRKAALRLGNWRLCHATLYSTLEPCAMCMGALMQARAARLVFGAFDAKFGAAGSLYDFSRDPRLNHRIRVMSGVEADPCRELMQAFFRDLRARKRSKRSG